MEYPKMIGKLPDMDELERLRAFNTGMSLTIGILLGIMSGLKSYLNKDQLEIVENADRNVHLMFYNHQFKVKVDE